VSPLRSSLRLHRSFATPSEVDEFLVGTNDPDAGAQPWGGGICPPEIFKILHSNFDICRNFQRIKMKFYIPSFLRSLLGIFLCPTGKLSPYKIYLETGHLIENFVNDWFNHKYAGNVKTWERV